MRGPRADSPDYFNYIDSFAVRAVLLVPLLITSWKYLRWEWGHGQRPRRRKPKRWCSLSRSSSVPAFQQTVLQRIGVVVDVIQGAVAARSLGV